MMSVFPIVDPSTAAATAPSGWITGDLIATGVGLGPYPKHDLAAKLARLVIADLSNAVATPSDKVELIEIGPATFFPPAASTPLAYDSTSVFSQALSFLAWMTQVNPQWSIIDQGQSTSPADLQAYVQRLWAMRRASPSGADPTFVLPYSPHHLGEVDAHTSVSSLEAWQVICRRVEGWLQLEDDWDGDSSIVPSQEVISNARNFLVSASHLEIQVPEVSLYGDGEAEFRWKKGNSTASVAFLDDGSVVAYVRSYTKAVPFKLDVADAKSADLTGLFTQLQNEF